jgi:hypothetical protein
MLLKQVLIFKILVICLFNTLIVYNSFLFEILLIQVLVLKNLVICLFNTLIV